MKWTDNLNVKGILFEDLKCGDGFERGGALYIKVSDNSAFDVINNIWSIFHDDILVLPRDCEIIFH